MTKYIAMLLMFVFAFSTVSMAEEEGEGANDFDKLIIKKRTAPKRQVVEDDEAPPPRRVPAKAPRQDDEQIPRAQADGYDDAHYIQSDDYFIQKHALNNNAWMYVDLAKSVTAPSSSTNGDGEFMKISDGQNYWTKYSWSTRIAAKHELRLGMHVIAFNDNHRDGVYRAPDKKDRARGGRWFYAKITDMSDQYKGYVTVSGNYKVSLDNIRLLLK